MKRIILLSIISLGTASTVIQALSIHLSQPAVTLAAEIPPPDCYPCQPPPCQEKSGCR